MYKLFRPGGCNPPNAPSLYLILSDTTVMLVTCAYSSCVIVMLQVLVVAFITTLLAFPNPYTRMNTSEMIRSLVSRCGPEDNNDLW